MAARRMMTPSEQMYEAAKRDTPMLVAAIETEIEKTLIDVYRRTRTVDHPSHYNRHPSGVECITIIEYMTHNCGAAMKYLWRAGLKDGSPLLEDLEKAAWYVAREIERVKRDKEMRPLQEQEGESRKILCEELQDGSGVPERAPGGPRHATDRKHTRKRDVRSRRGKKGAA